MKPRTIAKCLVLTCHSVVAFEITTLSRCGVSEAAVKSSCKDALTERLVQIALQLQGLTRLNTLFRALQSGTSETVPSSAHGDNFLVVVSTVD